MKQKTITTISVLSVIALVVFGLVSQNARIAKADLPEATIIPNYSIKYSSTKVGPYATSTNILATSTARIYADISNDGSNAVYLYFSDANSIITIQNPNTNYASGTASNAFSTSTPVSGHNGILLAASSTYEVTADKNMYFGAISAVALYGSTTIDVLSSQ